MQQYLIINLLSSVFSRQSSFVSRQSSFVSRQSSFVSRQSSFVSYPSSVFCPLHLSKTLYKSAIFSQNKPNFQKSQMNANSLATMNYENISNWTLGENKPNQTQFKPNLQNAQNERKHLSNKGLQKKRRFLSPTKQTQSNPISNPIKANFFKGQNELKIACRKIRPHPLGRRL